MIVTILTNTVICFMRGSVIYQNFCNLEAPSISAASYNEFDIFCKAARKYNILTPIQRQDPKITIRNIATQAVNIHINASKPHTTNNSYSTDDTHTATIRH